MYADNQLLSKVRIVVPEAHASYFRCVRVYTLSRVVENEAYLFVFSVMHDSIYVLVRIRHWYTCVEVVRAGTDIVITSRLQWSVRTRTPLCRNGALLPPCACFREIHALHFTKRALKASLSDFLHSYDHPKMQVLLLAWHYGLVCGQMQAYHSHTEKGNMPNARKVL